MEQNPLIGADTVHFVRVFLGGNLQIYYGGSARHIQISTQLLQIVFGIVCRNMDGKFLGDIGNQIRYAADAL